MIFIKINGLYKYYDTPLTVLEACIAQHVKIEIPRFCYSEKLSIAGNCRMRLVESDFSSKPIASCAISIEDGMEILTNTVMVKFARESVLEFLLINHPLDCPICDQGGECDLQDITFIYGNDRGRFYENKRAVKNKNFGSFISSSMTKCIHCTKCVRFLTEVAGTNELGTTGRGFKMEISNYIDKVILSELSGNIIDLCPVGALTSKPFTFKARSWELTHIYSIDIIDPLGTNIIIDIRGLEILRVLPRFNPLLNDEWIDDRTRFFYDGITTNRILYPYIRLPLENLFSINAKINFNKNKKTKLIATDWETIFLWLKLYFNNYLKFNNIKAFLGNYHDIQTITSYKDFCNTLGTSNLYYLNNINLNKSILDFRFNYIFSLPLTKINNFDIITYINFNPRLDAPLFNAKIRDVLNYKEIEFLNFGNPFNFTYEIENYGNNFYQLKNFIEGKLNNLINNYNKNFLFIIGIKNNKNNNFLLHLFKYLQKNIFKNITICFFNNFNSFITANDVGFINNQNSENLIIKKKHINENKSYFKNYFETLYDNDTKNFLNNKIFNKNNNININIIKNNINNNVYKNLNKYFLPKLKQDLYILLGDFSHVNYNKLNLNNNLIIYMGHHGEKLSLNSDIILPISSFIEKESFYVNFQGFYQRTNIVNIKPFFLRYDWRIFKMLLLLYLTNFIYMDIRTASGFGFFYLLHNKEDNKLKGISPNELFKTGRKEFLKILRDYYHYAFIEFEKNNKDDEDSILNNNLKNKIGFNKSFFGYNFFNYFIGFKEATESIEEFIEVIDKKTYKSNYTIINDFRIKNFITFLTLDLNTYNKNFFINSNNFYLLNKNYLYNKIYNLPFIAENYSIYNKDLIGRSSNNLSKGLKNFLLSKNFLWNSDII